MADAALQIEEVINANLTLAGAHLLATDDMRNRFKDRVGSEVVRANKDVNIGEYQIGVGPEQLLINSDRIRLDIGPQRSVINMEYPDANGLQRLSEVATLAIEVSNYHGRPLPAYGFNVDAVYRFAPGVTAGAFMSRRIFVPNLLPEHQLIGGTAVLNTIRNGRNWQIALQPRFQDLSSDRLFMTLNLNFANTNTPSIDRIRKRFTEVWENAHTILDHFNDKEV